MSPVVLFRTTDVYTWHDVGHIVEITNLSSASAIKLKHLTKLGQKGTQRVPGAFIQYQCTGEHGTHVRGRTLVFAPFAIGKFHHGTIHPVFWLSVDPESSFEQLMIVDRNHHGMVAHAGITQFKNRHGSTPDQSERMPEMSAALMLSRTGFTALAAI
ncbi:hypothetical protein ASD55_08290 [Rhodanobacter sp. Root561]|nr:hypothetical protein ASD55_08290 [Rhodanobacter sp. Root561]KRB52787.1 hypothetical protein ASD82_03040 [Rhodanobacter sp. Root179]